MSNQTVDFFSIRTLTNLHAGSGDTAYGIVDNMVQRDPASQIPIIHASSLKGALRQHFTELEEKDEGSNLTGAAAKRIAHIFGGDTSPRNKNKGESGGDFSAGSHLFFEAKLLVLPARSDRRQFYRAVCPELITEVFNSWKTYDFTPDIYLKAAFQFLAGKVPGIAFNPQKGKPEILVTSPETGDFALDDWQSPDVQIRQVASVFDPKKDGNTIGLLSNAERIFGENLVLLHIEDFKAICQKLPVIARNQLEDGISQNLFYEEVVPRESRFFSFVVRPEGDNAFVSKMKNTRVQVGANATIGYGQCNFFRFASEPKPTNAHPQK